MRKHLFIHHQLGIIHLMPLLLLALLVVGLVAAVSTAKQKQDIRSRAQMTHGNLSLSGDCVRLVPNQVDSMGNAVFDTSFVPAFCDTFDMPAHDLNDPNLPRVGQLDPTRWSFNRGVLANPSQGNFFTVGPTGVQFCRTLIPGPMDNPPGPGILPYKDSFMCDADGTETMHWMEAFNDEIGGTFFNDARPLQPFDFTGRTGTVVFDVDAHSLDGHAQWVEFWLTDEPVPLAGIETPPQMDAIPRNGVGIVFANNCRMPERYIGVGPLFLVRNFTMVDDGKAFQTPAGQRPDGQGNECAATQVDMFNHFEMKVNKNRIEVWATDKSPDHGITYPPLRLIAWKDNLNLPFEKGYANFAHVAYNSQKAGQNPPQVTYHWDNIGFDGPRHETPRMFDFPDARTPKRPDGLPGFNLGWYLGPEGMKACCQGSDAYDLNPSLITVKNVNLVGATTARLNFVMEAFEGGKQIQYRLNGGPWRTLISPLPGDAGSASGLTMPIPLSDLRNGDNILELKGQGGEQAISQVSILLEPGGLLPARVHSRGPTPTPTPCPGGFCPTPTPMPTMSVLPTSTPTPTPTTRPTNTPRPSSGQATPTPTPTSVPAGSLTVTFNDLSAGGGNPPLTGQYPSGVLNWGTSGWVLADPFGGFTTTSISFTNGPTSGTISVLQSRRLLSLDATNGGTAASTITLTCPGNPTKTQSVGAGQTMTIQTGFTTNCVTVTLSSSNGWDTNFDNLVFSAVSGGSTPTPNPSPTQAGGSTIQIFAAGTKGNGIYPRMSLLLNGKVVKSWSNVQGNPFTTTFQTFTYTSASKVTNTQVRVRFDNDFYGGGGNDRNLMVDRIVIDGTSFPSDAPSVFSTGTWDSTTGCAPGNKQSKWLQCNGWFQY